MMASSMTDPKRTSRRTCQPSLSLKRMSGNAPVSSASQARQGSALTAAVIAKPTSSAAVIAAGS